jgi:hypothetical protein
MQMNPELKQLIEDAAKLLGGVVVTSDCIEFICTVDGKPFNPIDPERGDLMKVAMAAELVIDARKNEGRIYYEFHEYADPNSISFDPDNYESLALAILRAASAVLKARGGE